MKMKKTLVSLLILFLASATLFAQEPTRKKHFNLEKGVAIQGYDPVAYFTKNKAVKGKKDLAVYYQGATYYFSSAENKESFKNNPSKYEPEYGGWCAYAMGAKGEKVEIDPETFKIINSKLYLFYNKFFNNTLKDWNKDENNLHTKADANWTKIFH
jgi:YHS domain-containing protein